MFEFTGALQFIETYEYPSAAGALGGQRTQCPVIAHCSTITSGQRMSAEGATRYAYEAPSDSAVVEIIKPTGTVQYVIDGQVDLQMVLPHGDVRLAFAGELVSEEVDDAGRCVRRVRFTRASAQAAT